MLTLIVLVVAVIPVAVIYKKVQKTDLQVQPRTSRVQHISYRVYRGDYLTALRVGWHRVNPIDICRCVSPEN